MGIETEFTSLAVDDLDEIRRHVVDQAGFDTAEAYLDRIVARCVSASLAPLTGTPRDDLAPGVRTIPFERRATIAYIVEKDRVVIQRVFHAGRDPSRGFDT